MPGRRRTKTFDEAANALDRFARHLQRGDSYSPAIELPVIDATTLLLERIEVTQELLGEPGLIAGLQLVNRITSLLGAEDRQQKGGTAAIEFVQRHLDSLAPLDRSKDAEALHQFAASLRTPGGGRVAVARGCLKRLDEMVARAEEIEALIGEESRLAGAAKAKARSLLSDLKATLRAERKRLRRIRSALTDVERFFYQPAIDQAAAYLTLRVNSVPGQEWLHQLGDLRTTLDAEGLRRDLRQSLTVES